MEGIKELLRKGEWARDWGEGRLLEGVEHEMRILTLGRRRL